MSRKKRQAPAKEKSFSNNPFGNLKGLSVSDGGERPEKSTSRPKADPPASRPGGEFFEEMAFLGVKAIACDSGDDPDLKAPVRQEESPASGEKIGPDAGDDDALFLEALGKLDTTFADELPTDESPPSAPRRMRELTRGRKAPEAELDLHGLDREQARIKVAHFLQNSHYQGLRTVLVITGRGQHSSEEPVLRSEIERFLAAEGRQWVVEWGRAPRRYGGDGALAIFLRSDKKGRE